jgi:hypothetical protein
MKLIDGQREPKGPPRNNYCIREPIQPAWRRDSSVKYVNGFALLVSCQAGASAPSVRRIYFSADPKSTFANTECSK